METIINGILDMVFSGKGCADCERLDIENECFCSYCGSNLFKPTEKYKETLRNDIKKILEDNNYGKEQ